MIAQRRTAMVTIAELGMIGAAILFLTPFYFVVVNSLKPYGEILKNAASLPVTITWGNYVNAIEKIHFPRVLFNSLIITTVSIFLLVVFGSMTSCGLSGTAPKVRLYCSLPL